MEIKFRFYKTRVIVEFIKTTPFTIFVFYFKSRYINLFFPHPFQLSSTAKVARWFAQLQNWNQTNLTLSRPESGFVSGDSRSERVNADEADEADNAKDPDFCDEYLLVEGTANLWAKLSAKKRKKLMGLRFGKVTTF